MTATHQADRVAAALESFTTANATLVRRLEQLSDEAAARKPADQGWSAAQIGVHVGIANELFAAVLSGAMPMAAPAPAGFAETWSAAGVPERIQTFPMLVPPDAPTRQDAVTRLRASGDQLAAAIRSVPAERWTGCCVALPFGTLSMYQFAEFAGMHAVRHNGQLDRVLALA